MKMTQQHFATLKASIEPLDTQEKRKAYQDAGMSAKRYRWDLLWATLQTRFVCDELYQYLNDDHIDTALRSIVKPY